MAAMTINILTDGDLAARAESVLAEWGLDVPTAVNLFLTQVADKKELQIPLPPRVRVVPKLGGWEGKIWMADDFDAPMEPVGSPPPPVKKMPQPGCLKGRIWMADDFDAPMEEFKDYM